VALNFFENRNNPAAFEPVPEMPEPAGNDKLAKNSFDNVYTVSVDGQDYVVKVNEGGDIIQGPVAAETELNQQQSSPAPINNNDTQAEAVSAPLAGQIFKIPVTVNQQINEGDVLIILEAMKMETEVRASKNGCITEISVKEGDAVGVGECLIKMIYQ